MVDVRHVSVAAEEVLSVLSKTIIVTYTKNHYYHLVQCAIVGNQSTFWLAVHGKPVLFWKGISGLKFPCFLFYAC